MVSNQVVTEQYRFAEFFAGIGLVRMGLERASPAFSCVFANDLDDQKRIMYSHHFRCSIDEINGEDVHLLDTSEVSRIDLATASFPCTDLSLAGSRKGVHKGESSAFWGFHRVLKELGDERPTVVLLENVVGLLSSNNGSDLEDVLISMNQLGYAVDPIILDARWFVPQSRQRLFVVCVLKDCVPNTNHTQYLESRIRPQKLLNFIKDRSTAIDWFVTQYPEPPKKSRRELEDIIVDPPYDSADWWSEDRVEYLLNQMFPRHLSWVDEHIDEPDYHYATAFRRVRPQGDGTKRSMAELRTDGIAGCLRTPKGGSGRQIIVRAGRKSVRVRLLSPVECASLMGAKGFRVSGTQNQALFGFGDAVCVDAISWIAKNAILPVLRGVETQLCGYAVDDARHSALSK